MDIKHIFQRIQNIFKPQEELQDEVIVKFLRILEDVRAEDMSCDEMFIRLDEFVETEVNRMTQRNLCRFREHLDLCPDCDEEYEALLTVL
jgi:hypothetical protein